jgi:hypothetical protein
VKADKGATKLAVKPTQKPVDGSLKTLVVSLRLPSLFLASLSSLGGTLDLLEVSRVGGVLMATKSGRKTTLPQRFVQ